jgi:ethanolaminephosphotransferase
MIPKQREMDDIIRRIFTAIESQPHLQNTLFVVAGDHGMNSKGNHGGSSPGETSAALLFISPHLKKLGRGRPCPTKPHTGSFGFYTLVDQSDVVATLAGLLGFPLPKYSLGIFIRNFLPLLGGPLQHLQYLQTNAAQLINIFRSQNPPSANCNSTTDNTRLDCLWDDFQTTKDTTGSGAEDIIDQLYEVLLPLEFLNGEWHM